MFIGYSRVSTNDQNLDLQIDNLKSAGCQKIFKDKLSGAKSLRPGLEKLFDILRPGDTVIVWRLDRLGRSLKDLIDIINKFKAKEVTFKSISENIDTTTASGELVFHIFCSLAQFERKLIKERINAGIAAAKARGKVVGRKKGISKEAQQKASLASALYIKNDWSTTEICNHLNISRASLYKYLKLQNTPIRAYIPKYEIIS